MKYIPKFQSWCKQIRKDHKSKIYIGLDVHKRTINMAIWHRGRIAINTCLPAGHNHLLQTLKKIPCKIKKIAYEAGPTGYGLARALKKAKYPVVIIAPSSILVPRGRKTKTDRLDCQDLAQQLAAGNQLREVTMPTMQEEADRQIYRMREQQVKKRKRIKQQIKSFLLQHSIAEPEGLDNWTKTSRQQLRHLELPDNLSLSLRYMISELEEFDFRISDIEDHLKNFFIDPRYNPHLELLLSHPAVGCLTALAFKLEIHQPERFNSPQSIAQYVGLAPRVRQSGEKSVGGPLEKAGKSDLRNKLIEAAWRWVNKDQRARNLYGRLLKNCGNGKKAIVGVARHLAIILWQMLLNNKPYMPTA